MCERWRHSVPAPQRVQHGRPAGRAGRGGGRRRAVAVDAPAPPPHLLPCSHAGALGAADHQRGEGGQAPRRDGAAEQVGGAGKRELLEVFCALGKHAMWGTHGWLGEMNNRALAGWLWLSSMALLRPGHAPSRTAGTAAHTLDCGCVLLNVCHIARLLSRLPLHARLRSRGGRGARQRVHMFCVCVCVLRFGGAVCP